MKPGPMTYSEEKLLIFFGQVEAFFLSCVLVSWSQTATGTFPSHNRQYRLQITERMQLLLWSGNV